MIYGKDLHPHINPSPPPSSLLPHHPPYPSTPNADKLRKEKSEMKKLQGVSICIVVKQARNKDDLAAVLDSHLPATINFLVSFLRLCRLIEVKLLNWSGRDFIEGIRLMDSCNLYSVCNYSC